MNTRPTNAAQIRRMSDQELTAFLSLCEDRGDTGVLYQLACDEEIEREETPRAVYYDQQKRWC